MSAEFYRATARADGHDVCKRSFSGGAMNRLLVVSAGVIALALPTMAQRQAYPNYRDSLKTVAYQPQGQVDSGWRDDNGRGARLSADDQQRFDSYYTRWVEYRRTNNGDEIRSMEKRMQDIYSHYGIPSNTPYERIASNGGYGQGDQRGRWGDNNGNWGGATHARLSADDQQRFDSYYSRWLQYRATSNQSEVSSMEGRMRDIYSHYGIPSNTPFSSVASVRY
jgi:hypothetical protein